MKPKSGVSTQTRKVWLVFGCRGNYRGIFNTEGDARMEMTFRNEGPYSWKPYRVVRATLTWPTKGEGR